MTKPEQRGSSRYGEKTTRKRAVREGGRKHIAEKNLRMDSGTWLLIRHENDLETGVRG